MTATEKLRRKPGRPKGTPKTGGRQKGTPNRSTVQTRDRIQELADPIAFLADVMAGKRLVAAGEPGDMKTTWCWPTLAQRVQAGETLLRKLLPDLKATELTGNIQPVITAIERRIVDHGSDAAEATKAQADRQASNGVAEGAGRLMQDGTDTKAHIEFRERKRGGPDLT